MITIGSLTIDAALSEEHQLSSAVTSFPVEKGADITDHVRKLPRVVEIEGIVSDTPLGLALIRREGVEALIEEGLIERTLPSIEAWQQLEAIHEAATPVDITTSLRLYKSMVLESLSVPRDAKNRGALRFNATFRQVLIVENKRVRKRVAVPRAAGGKRRGSIPSQWIDGKPAYTCLEDRLVWVKPEDFAAASASSRPSTPATWSDYKSLPQGAYTRAARICARKERVTEVRSPVGRRLFRTDASGKQVPLTDAEMDEIRDRTPAISPFGVDSPTPFDSPRPGTLLGPRDSRPWWERPAASPYEAALDDYLDAGGRL